jgi:hypothetical protein
MHQPPPRVLKEEEPRGVSEESLGVEEERCGGPPTSPLSRLMKPPRDAGEEWCGGE